MVSRECLDCGLQYDLLQWKDGTELSQDNAVAEDTSCPSCHSDEKKKILTVGRGIWTGDEAGVGKIYPYYDRSLEMRIHSKAHHDRVMQERGLQHADAAGVEAEWNEVERDYAEARAYMDEWDDEIAHHPDLRGYREMAAKGKFTDNLPEAFRDRAKKKLISQFER